MLFFRSEENVLNWCKNNNVPLRPLVSLDQLWYLAKAWYENRLTIESRRPAPDEMIQIFDKIGLTDPFWNPKDDRWASST